MAAGGYHTVGLKGDGTVVVVGDNRAGQCNVGGWSGIVQVAAGSYHTVGLKGDGTEKITLTLDSKGKFSTVKSFEAKKVLSTP